jgi:hypothetical protein
VQSGEARVRGDDAAVDDGATLPIQRHVMVFSGDPRGSICLRIRTSVVGGPLALQMRRAAAARANYSGLQIWTPPLLAARLVGGFATPLTPERLDLAVQDALAEGGLAELENVRHLLGMTGRFRGAFASSGTPTSMSARKSPENVRLGDLALIEASPNLPVAMLAPRDLRSARSRPRFLRVTDEQMKHAQFQPVMVHSLSEVSAACASLLGSPGATALRARPGLRIAVASSADWEVTESKSRAPLSGRTGRRSGAQWCLRSGCPNSTPRGSSSPPPDSFLIKVNS